MNRAFTPAQDAEIRSLYEAIPLSLRDLAVRYGRRHSVIEAAIARAGGKLRTREESYRATPPSEYRTDEVVVRKVRTMADSRQRTVAEIYAAPSDEITDSSMTYQMVRLREEEWVACYKLATELGLRDTSALIRQAVLTYLAATNSLP